MTIQVNGLQFQTGFNGILGPQGVGKTRLLQKIATLDHSVEIAEPECGTVCYVSCELDTFVDLTVEEYLASLVDPNEKQQDIMTGPVVFAQERLNLTHYANVPLSDLPKVVKAKTLIAKALLQDAHVLLFDDVLDGLSLDERMHIGYLLNEIGKERVIVLAGTFNQSVEGMFDTVCMLHPTKEAVMVPVNTAYEWVEGKVWEYVTSEAPSPDEHIVSSLKQADDGVYVREIAQEVPFEEVSQVTPMLRDAYLWWSKQ